MTWKKKKKRQDLRKSKIREKRAKEGEREQRKKMNPLGKQPGSWYQPPPQEERKGRSPSKDKVHKTPGLST